MVTRWRMMWLGEEWRCASRGQGDAQTHSKRTWYNCRAPCINAQLAVDRAGTPWRCGWRKPAWPSPPALQPDSQKSPAQAFGKTCRSGRAAPHPCGCTAGSRLRRSRACGEARQLPAHALGAARACSLGCKWWHGSVACCCLANTLPRCAPMLPALDPDTTWGSMLACSSARTTPKCLRAVGKHGAGGAWACRVHGRQEQGAASTAFGAAQQKAQGSCLPEAEAAAAAEHQAGAAVGMAQLPQEGLPLLQCHAWGVGDGRRALFPLGKPRGAICPCSCASRC